MNAWDSVPLMTVIDLAICIATGLALRAVYSLRASERGRRFAGPRLVAAGLALLAAFFLADLVTMWVVPVLASEQAGYQAMEQLHLNWSWPIMLAVVLTLTAGVVVTSRSVREAQRRIARGSRLYQKVVETQTEFIVRWLPDGTRTFVNDAYSRYFETPREELIGTSFMPLIAEEDREQVLRRIRALSPEAPVSTAEHRVIRPDGSQGWQEWTDRGIFDDRGDLQEYQSIGRDVTARKQTQEELRNSEEKFSRVFHGSPDPIAISEVPSGAYVDVNEAFVRSLGYTSDDVVGRTAEELGLYVNPRQREPLLEELRSDGEALVPELQLRARDGRILLFEITAFSMQLGERECNVAIGRDITQRKQIERDREKAWMEIARLKEELERERDYLREEVTTSRRFGQIIGDSPPLKRVLSRIDAVAATDATVLIEGESGVGKELVAREIHARSDRSAGPLVRVNCASVPRDLFESEFFGHVKGAFTGAHRDRAGRFSLAHRGTLFLDEVAEIPVELQAKLLRALQDGEYQLVGEERSRRADVRVIAATNRDLKTEVESGRFREDLYYRLSVFPIDVPPLRERRGDIVPLAQHFLSSACKEFGRSKLALSQQQALVLREQEWPGNVRQLRNVIEQAVILSRGERLRLDLALAGAAGGATEGSSVEEPGGADRGFVTVAELKRRERDNIRAALDFAGWKVSGKDGAAELLGIKATTLRYKINAFGIERPS